MAPQFASVSAEDLATWSEVAALIVARSRFRGLTMRAHALLTAHFLATTPGLGLGPGGGDEAAEAALGPLSAEADGPSSRSFGAVVSAGSSADPTDAALARSPWGLAFLALRRAARGFGTACVANGVNRIRH